MTVLSLISAVADLIMVILSYQLPLTDAEHLLDEVLGYVYLSLHNLTNVIILLFLLSLTRMTSLIQKKWIKFVISLPYVLIVAFLIQNIFTHTIFPLRLRQDMRAAC